MKVDMFFFLVRKSGYVCYIASNHEVKSVESLGELDVQSEAKDISPLLNSKK